MSQPNLQVQRTDFAVPAEAASWQKTWLIIGVVGALACVAGLRHATGAVAARLPDRLHAVAGTEPGLHGAADGAASVGRAVGISIRRILEAASKGLPLMAVLFLPILFGRNQLYAWMTDASLTEHNAWYLNTPGWMVRFAAVFRDLDRHGVRAEQALGAAG